MNLWRQEFLPTCSDDRASDYIAVVVRFPPKALIQNIVRLIKQGGGFIQANEITTGIGRTGEWFGFQHYDFQPDIVSMGKGLGNGYPVSAIAMSAKIIDHLNRVSFHYSLSHQNDPLGCAVALQVLNTLQAENLIGECKEKGFYLFNKLVELRKKYPVIKDVRGRGLMIAVEFSDSLDEKGVSEIYRQLLSHGIILAKRPGLKVFRIDPPLIIEKKDVDDFLQNFEQLIRN